MMSPPVLAMPNFQQDFILETDASGGGIGVVLMQNARPIIYFSKALAPKHLGLSVYEKEMMVVVSAVAKWRPYLIGNHFVIKLGVENKVADALSRKPQVSQISVDTIECLALSVVSSDLLVEVQQSWQEDDHIKCLIQKLSSTNGVDGHYTWTNNQLRRKGKLVVGKNVDLRNKIISIWHASATSGHSRILVTYHNVKGAFIGSICTIHSIQSINFLVG
ncbi:hypothetical protein ACH5RR_009734 [Cinchona calisaya]|uniref:Reverse transcriptase/retrotransposon-derived protein RNase H-like domain-containing protein n=1 Tax=Cinchona calisaya TaxID=153742 RepID=A0ABD3AFA7_9GENT